MSKFENIILLTHTLAIPVSTTSKMQNSIDIQRHFRSIDIKSSDMWMQLWTFSMFWEILGICTELEVTETYLITLNLRNTAGQWKLRERRKVMAIHIQQIKTEQNMYIRSSWALLRFIDKREQFCQSTSNIIFIITSWRVCDNEYSTLAGHIYVQSWNWTSFKCGCC